MDLLESKNFSVRVGEVAHESQAAGWVATSDPPYLGTSGNRLMATIVIVPYRAILWVILFGTFQIDIAIMLPYGSYRHMIAILWVISCHIATRHRRAHLIAEQRSAHVLRMESDLRRANST